MAVSSEALVAANHMLAHWRRRRAGEVLRGILSPQYRFVMGLPKLGPSPDAETWATWLAVVGSPTEVNAVP